MDEGTVSPEVVVVGPDGVPWRKKRSQQQRRASAFRSVKQNLFFREGQVNYIIYAFG